MKVRYQIFARMEECNDTSKSTFKPFIATRKLIVRKPVENVAISRSMTLEKKIKTLFFVKQGTAKVDIVFEKDAYSPIDTARVLAKIDNSQCEKDIKQVKLQLRRMITCFAKDKIKF